MSTNWYVDSNAVGTNAGTSPTNAWTSLNSAIAANAVAAGDTIYVSDAHSETGFTTPYANPGTIAARCRILSVDHTTWATTPTLKAGATVASASATSISCTGFFYCYGITWKPGAGTASLAQCSPASGQGNYQRYEACQFWLNNSNVSSNVNLSGSSAAIIDAVNCTVRFGSASQHVNWLGIARWRNTGAAIDSGGSTPNTMFNGSSSGFGIAEGIDLSALSAKTLMSNLTTTTVLSAFKDCRLP